MSKHVITLEVDGSTCFDVIRATGADMADLGFCLSTPLLTGEMPGLIDAVRLAVYGIVVTGIAPAAPEAESEQGKEGRP